jgi:hypothetical protein
MSRCAVFLLWLCLGFSRVEAQETLSGLLEALSGMKSLTLPIGPDSGKPTLKFSCESLAVERKAFGFMRIGVVPEVVLVDVKMRIMNSPNSSTWAEQLAAFLTSDKTSRSVIIRNLRIETKDRQFFVMAPEAKIQNNPIGIIVKNATVVGDQWQLDGQQGFIALMGPNAGQLVIAEPSQPMIAITDSSISTTNTSVSDPH